jgi:hypothetical protein
MNLMGRPWNRRPLAACKANPLTARVAVNRYWEQLFGIGIVASSEDLGSQSEPPTHPELLDWLAVEFMEHGWSMKHLHRLIVTSASYRMAASGDVANRVADPENHFLWRMNPGQMEAEVVRDSLLHVAGELDLARAGQSLPNSEAEKSKRRSLYFECFPEPGGNSMLAEVFDPPSSLDCYRRTATIVPQQALALSNSALSAECSRTLADRLPVGEDDAFITAAFEQVLARRPADDDLAACRDFLARQRQDGRSDTALARRNGK